MTARQIQRALQDDPMMKKAKLSLPSLRQVQNQKTELGRKRGYSNTMTLDDVKKYYEENKEITEDEDRPYAVAFYFENITVRGEDKVERPSVKFILVMSTLRLVRRQAFSMVLQADGTYGWSKDPERQSPARLPTIPRNPKSNMRKAMEKLRDEKRAFVPFMLDGDYIWLIRSSNCAEEQDLQELWTELQQAKQDEDPQFKFSSW
uniref:Uncharacterized protein n=1 Tax=Ditylenchus dipsaci TaxID=166011 RepID=A0A915EMT6_9BILA